MLKGGAQEVGRQVQGQHHKRDQQPKEDKGQSLAWGNVENAITGIGRPTDGTLWGGGYTNICVKKPRGPEKGVANSLIFSLYLAHLKDNGTGSRMLQ